MRGSSRNDASTAFARGFLRAIERGTGRAVRRAAMVKKLTALVAACGLGVLGAAGTVGCSSESSPKEECTDTGSEALRTCAKGATLKGVDVSYYQGNVNWAAVKGSGHVYAFARVSDGLNYPDSKFAQNWPAMKAAGIIRGTYQFFRPGQDPKAQAKLLVDKINAAGGMQPGDLPPVLDIEAADGVAAATVQARAKTWLLEVEKAFGVKPIVYTANFMSPTIGTALASYTLWVANYGATCPLMPDGWTKWAFWQSSSTASVAGISGNVDFDQFDGTLTQLQALTLQAAPPPADAGAGDGGAKGDAGTGPVVDPGGAKPNDGSEGQTLGSGNPEPPTTTGATIDPCAPK